MPTTRKAQDIYSPPGAFVPLTSDLWRKWHTEVVWALIGKGVDKSGVQGTFPQLQIGAASFTNENAFQDLLNVDKGLYVNYTSSVGNIIYGFASNVYRSAGKELAVGGQFSAYANPGVSGTIIFGGNINAIAFERTDVALVALELDIATHCSTSRQPKVALNTVFGNYGADKEGLGSNLYNYWARAYVINSSPRSAAGEYCGWNVGIDFENFWGDQDLPPAWSAVVTYSGSQCVTSGGVVWKGIQGSLNQLPAAGSIYWVQRTAAGVANLAIGIDFSAMSITSMARMASAIRLRSSQFIHWEETGAIGTKYDAVTALLHVLNNQGVIKFQVHSGTGDALAAGNVTAGGNLIATGNIQFGQAVDALGGGAAPAFGTMGGTGPTIAAQNSWQRILLSTGATAWIPVWK